MKTVKEWLRDFYQMTEGNEIRDILGGVWDCEVESVWHARSLVNTTIDTQITWLEGFKFDFQSQLKRLVEHGFDIPNI